MTSWPLVAPPGSSRPGVACNARSASVSSSVRTCDGSNPPRLSGRAAFNARIRSPRCHAALPACTCASAVSITACGENASVAGWSACPNAATATASRPVSISDRSWVDQRVSRASIVSPVWDFPGRVANVAVRDSRSSSSAFGSRPYLASNAAASRRVLAVIARRRVLNNSSTSAGIPSTSRALPSGRVANRSPNVRERCSSITRSAIAPAAPR